MECTERNYNILRTISKEQIKSYDEFILECQAQEGEYSDSETSIEEIESSFDNICKELNCYNSEFYFNDAKTSLYLDSEDFETEDEFLEVVENSISTETCCFEFVEVENYDGYKRAVWHRV